MLPNVLLDDLIQKPVDRTSQRRDQMEGLRAIRVHCDRTFNGLKLSGDFANTLDQASLFEWSAE